MQPNPNDGGMNQAMRRAGNRSRSLPNIGQTPAVQAANMVMGQSSQNGPAPSGPPPLTAPMPPPMGTPSSPSPMVAMPAPASPPPQSPMAAPSFQNSFTLHPPGAPADSNQYNYEPQADGSWRVYPPDVNAPNHTVRASLPRAASTADYRRMRQAFQSQPQTQTVQQPTPLV